ncbi:Quinone oxidoreductase 2 [Sphingomonas haloaromaticamans]|uniref:Quinone oxidoreductase 2 n=2 Tax=Edaphosphingomonas haloaromaticamans TaxID=653954 RepID=A0A1S1HBA6_9SPHN|nr:NmrA family NAD(P)-binding protein [Sphingomonas haloaromaticamans]OHT19102.1 Quinone oxidoreductase 2 [Sphingomonas haloaromaticamans]
MYAITGITGKVGGALATALLDAVLPVRAVVRDAAKAAGWKARGCDMVVAAMEDEDALAAAFTGAEGVFILPPSDFDPEPGYPEARRVIAAVRNALGRARPGRIVCLSTIGADAEKDNLLTQRSLMEQALATLPIPVTFLRAGWFLDNAAWDVASAIEEGVIRSFLQPLDRRIAMVAARDVGRTAAALVRERWKGVRVVQLEGPTRVSPNDIAAAFSEALGRPVRAGIVPRDEWDAIFRAQGMRHPLPRIRMLDGFNEGWIDFPKNDPAVIKGKTDVADVIASLVRAEALATE